jgi:protein-S-isoprenylcysteine O-methyltransferase Ste14
MSARVLFERMISSSMVSKFSGFALAILWVIFAYRHIEAYRTTGYLVFLIFCFSETLQAIFFLIRTKPKVVSTDPFDWAVAIGGTFTAFCFRPGGVVLWQGGMILLSLGFCFQIIALISLNRSFAIVPAKRKIKTALAYQVVRHPMYASYSISNIGYVLFNASILNGLCLFFILTFFVLRIIEEEKLLVNDEEYRRYQARVPYRLIPFVY